MSITPEEQRALAIECGADEYKSVSGRATHYRFEDYQLIAYTAAVESAARESVRVEMLTVEECNDMQHLAFAAGVESAVKKDQK
jgi:hypothetical protein